MKNLFSLILFLSLATILLKGQTQLTLIHTLNVEAQHTFVINGDANNDGQNEIVTLSNKFARIYKWDGSSFQKLWEKASADSSHNKFTGFIGDCDNDGQNELILRDGYWSSETIKIYKYSSGTWNEVWTKSSASQADPWHTWVGDCDYDGQNELIFGYGYGDRRIEIYKYSSGTYSLWKTLHSGTDVYSVQTIDLDGDGKNELLVGDAFFGPPGVSIYKYNTTSGNFDKVWSYTTGEQNTFVATGGDLDNDGKNEILVTINHGWGTMKGVKIFKHTSGNTYNEIWGWDQSKAAFLPTIGDILNAGKNQFSFYAEDSTTYIFEKGSSTFDLVQSIQSAAGVVDTRLGKVFNDGKNAMAISTYNGKINFYMFTPTSIDKRHILQANNFLLLQNYPNPFNPSTTIRYAISEPAKVTIKVYDLLGKEVATLLRKEQETGYHEVEFNATNLASGTYIYKIVAGEFVQSKKMILLK